MSHCILACPDLWCFWHLPSLLGSLGPVHHSSFDSFLSIAGRASWFNIRIESVFSNKCPFVVTSPSYLLNRYNSTFFIWSSYFLKLSNWKVQLVPWHLQQTVWIPELHCLLALNFIAGISLAHELQQPWICQFSAGWHLFPCFSHWPGGTPPSLTSHEYPFSLGFFPLSFSLSSDFFIGLVTFLLSALSSCSVVLEETE